MRSYSLNHKSIDCLSRGFTLMELLVVIGIISIIVTMASFSLISLVDRSKVEGASSNLSTFFRLVRQSAVTTKSDRYLMIDLAKEQYWMAKYDEGETEPYKRYPRLTDVYQVPEGVDISDINGLTENDNIQWAVYRFSPSGNFDGDKAFGYINYQGNFKTYNQRIEGLLIHVIRENEFIEFDNGQRELYEPSRNYSGLHGNRARNLTDEQYQNHLDQRSKCNTILILSLTGRAKLLRYGYGPPWSLEPTFPQLLME